MSNRIRKAFAYALLTSLLLLAVPASLPAAELGGVQVSTSQQEPGLLGQVWSWFAAILGGGEPDNTDGRAEGTGDG